MRSIDASTARQPCSGGHLDARIAAVAGGQGGVISRAQLRGLGLSGSGIDARVQRGALHTVHRGVYAVGHPVVRGRGLDHAAVLAAGPGAARSHRSAGEAWDLRAWGSRTVEVTASRGRTSRPGLRVFHARLPRADVTVLDGLATTTLARTLFDLAEVLTREQHLRAWQEAERLRLLDVAAVRAVVARSPGRRALGVMLPLLAAARLPGLAETRSPLEADFLPFAATHLARFGPPRVNVMVAGFEVDVRYERARVSVELDSHQHHDHAAAFERDRAKWNALTAAGEVVFPLTARRLRDEPELVGRQLTALLDSRWG